MVRTLLHKVVFFFYLNFLGLYKQKNAYIMNDIYHMLYVVKNIK